MIDVYTVDSQFFLQTARHCTLLFVTKKLTWPYKDVFWDQTKNFGKQNPILTQFWVLQQSCPPSGSKNVNIEFSKILPQTRKIIDTRHSCAEKTIMEGWCSLVYEYFVIFKLSWMQSDVTARISLRSGFRVRITADRKLQYTLVLGFPFLIKRKLPTYHTLGHTFMPVHKFDVLLNFCWR